MFVELIYGMISLLTFPLLPYSTKCLYVHQKFAASGHTFYSRVLLSDSKNDNAHSFAISAVFVKISTRVHKILDSAVGATGELTSEYLRKAIL